MASFIGDHDDALNMIVASTASSLRKRKREDERSVLGDSFVIKVTSPHLYGCPRIFNTIKFLNIV